MVQVGKLGMGSYTKIFVQSLFYFRTANLQTEKGQNFLPSLVQSGDGGKEVFARRGLFNPAGNGVGILILQVFNNSRSAFTGPGPDYGSLVFLIAKSLLKMANIIA
jgi:hypothetical protein